MEVNKNLESWDNFLDNATVSLHCVDSQGIIVWANATELNFLGYKPEEYIGHFIGDFHVDEPVINDMLDRLTRDVGLSCYPARVRKKDGTIEHVIISSNVYREKGVFIHTRCFTSAIQQQVWEFMKDNKDSATDARC